MKTKFIEGTNKQYSIREDGVVFGPRGKMSIQKRKNGGTVVNIKINNKRNNLSLRGLLLKYFNKFICIHCNKESKNIKERRGFICKECKLNNSNKRVREYYLNNHDKKINRQRESRKKLDNFYVHITLGFKVSDNINPEIINSKKNQLKLHRELKKQKQNDTN